MKSDLYAMTDVIDFWPNVEAFAQDAGVEVTLVAVWRSRGTIPYSRWYRLDLAAERRRIRGFQLRELARLVEERAQ